MCERRSDSSARRPEIVAPAGNAETMRAAVRAGADAVYFGLRGFNARAGAENFDANGVASAMRMLHRSFVRGYVALNTLVFDDELERVEAAVRACAAAGVDALVVQDLGVVRLIRAVAPDMRIHASTQMTCADVSAARLAARMGIKRVILARELSIDEIGAVRSETDVELEVFVHGAMCISYSGQCLASEALGGRSGNRGECAQPCRLPYRPVVDGKLRDLKDRAYLLSAQDLEATAFVRRLAAIGVDAFKIEGRLKGPDYVMAATRLYRKALDRGHGSTREDLVLALQAFSRGSGPGFLGGMDHQRLVEGRSSDHRGVRVGVCRGRREVRGKTYVAVALETTVARGEGVLVEGGFAGDGEVGGRVWALLVRGRSVERASKGDEALVWLGPGKRVPTLPEGRRVFRTSDPAGEKRMRADLTRRPYREPLDLRITGKLGGKPAFDAVTGRGATVRVVGDCALQAARTAPLDAENVREKIGRLGATPFELGRVAIDWPKKAIVPVSSLSRAKKAIVDELLRSCDRDWSTTGTTHRDLLANAGPPERPPLPEGLFVLCRSAAQVVPALKAGADGVYLDFANLTETADAVRSLRASTKAMIGLAAPRVRKPAEEKIDRYLESLNPDSVLVRTIGALGEGESSAPKIGDFSLNVTNSLCAAIVLSHGLRAFTPSLELGADKLASLLQPPLARYAEIVVHQRMPLFHTEHCMFAALLSRGHDRKSCGRPCERYELSLRDRKGFDLEVLVDAGCRNTVFHARPCNASAAFPDLKTRGVGRFRIELVREKPDEVRKIVSAYRRLLDGRTP